VALPVTLFETGTGATCYPGSLILSGEMMLRYLGWTGAADLVISAMNATIKQKTVTYDFARLMDKATEIKCSEFADALISNM